MKRKDFIHYLVHTLIPDLTASGSTATAVDFAAAVRFLQDPDRKEVPIPYAESEFPDFLLQLYVDTKHSEEEVTTKQNHNKQNKKTKQYE
jgi:hypothetical protein